MADLRELMTLGIDVNAALVIDNSVFPRHRRNGGSERRGTCESGLRSPTAPKEKSNNASTQRLLVNNHSHYYNEPSSRLLNEAAILDEEDADPGFLESDDEGAAILGNPSCQAMMSSTIVCKGSFPVDGVQVTAL